MRPAAAAFSAVRPPAHAGRFYPADPGELARTVHALLTAAGRDLSGPPAGLPRVLQPTAAGPAVGVSAGRLRALIAPHAGYQFSGATAGAAFAVFAAAHVSALARRAAGAATAAGEPSPEGTGLYRRAVIIGPAHRVGFEGIACGDFGVMATPLGEAVVDARAQATLVQTADVAVIPAAHQLEHCIEVMVPFLQVIDSNLPIVPLLTGHWAAERVAAVLETLWDDTTLLIVSTDLSHFHSDAEARRLDAQTCAAIAAGRFRDLAAADACGVTATVGMLRAATLRGYQIEQLDYRTSGDARGGDPRRVVGYAAFAVREAVAADCGRLAAP